MTCWQPPSGPCLSACASSCAREACPVDELDSAFIGKSTLGPRQNCAVQGALCLVASGSGCARLGPLDACSQIADEDPWADITDKQRRDPAPLFAPTWWFRAGCFLYSAVGVTMACHLAVLTCLYPDYFWNVETSLLLLQGLLSYLHDSHFQGRSFLAKTADRTCASFLTMCQPLKFAFCPMDVVQVGLLSFWLLVGLMCLKLGFIYTSKGDFARMQVAHTMWHVALPLGGFLWIEYTSGSVATATVSSAAPLMLSRTDLPGAEAVALTVGAVRDCSTVATGGTFDLLALIRGQGL
eukprot:TRINITY_DN26251_c0_g1_i1.p1 TRINITY_DN26251_c0_g1~~TRINITY_DN26251_c0_g1_i1.p1  ORF type:complete len:316 (-),score=17.80 TRINITY_DN26251_c0_g1_i1:50-937(-)